MKGKRYRSNFAKTVWIVIAHLAAVAAAVCMVAFVALYEKGIRLDDRNKNYIESEEFNNELRQKGTDIIGGLSVQEDINFLKNAGSSAVIDLFEFKEKGNSRDAIKELSMKDVSGLAYSVNDILEWAKDWDGSEAYYDNGNIIQCRTTDGTSHCFYLDDFKKRIAEGTLKIDYNKDYFDLDADEFWDKTDAQKVDVAYDLVYWNSDESQNIGSVTDVTTGVEYSETYFLSVNGLAEKFAPQGADNLLDAVNSSEEWSGSPRGAYDELANLLDCISSVQNDAKTYEYTVAQDNSFQPTGECEEGSSNLTYLFADKKAKTVYTNKEAYGNYTQLEQNLEKILKEHTFAVVYPDLSECVTDIPNISLQVWNHTIKQSLDTEDFVFAVNVDTEFPIADSIASDAETFEKYANLMLPVLLGTILSCVIWLISMIWLTVAAGRKPEDEEIHLNSFDRWYTEIAAGVVTGVWLVGFMGMVTVIANSLIGTFNNMQILIISLVICGIYTMAWFLTGYLSLVRRIKAGTFWKNSLLRKILKWIGKCNRKIVDFIGSFSRNTSEKIKVLFGIGGFVFLQFLLMLFMINASGVFALVLIVADVAAIVYAVRKVDGLDLIMDGLKKISGGELQYKIKTEQLTGKYKVMAEYINNIGDGLDAAVENSLKKERMQTELITNVSHDIKTPLTSIINYVDLLEKEDLHNETAQEYLEVLERQSSRLKKLIEDLIEASKASTGNLPVHLERLEAGIFMTQTVGEFEEKTKAAGLDLVIEKPETPVYIMADSRHFWRVIDNLMNNICKYAQSGTRVYINLEVKEAQVSITFRNTSKYPLNISSDELMERFVRGDASRNTEGSGLGLSIANSLMDLMGGTFRLYVDGDLFKVVLGFAETAEKETKEKIEEL